MISLQTFSNCNLIPVQISSLQVRLKKLEYYEKIGYLSCGNVEVQNFNCIGLTGPKLIYPQLYVGIIEQLWFPHNDH